MGQYLTRVEAKMIVSKMLKKYDVKSKNPINMKKLFFFVTQHSEFEVKKDKRSKQFDDFVCLNNYCKGFTKIDRKRIEIIKL